MGNIKIKTVFLLVGLLLIITLSNGQNFDKAKMDSLFSRIESFEKGMGSVSIFQNGKEVYQRSYGYADFENKIKSDSATKYRIGSISKTFTATVIMKLIEEGKISLSSKLSEFYPQIKNSEKITIEHLLQHRSGIFSFTSAADYMKWNTKKQTKKQLINRIQTYGSLFEPDKQFEYSNSNYTLLSFIAEDASGESFEKLINRIIIETCNLKNTSIGAKINPINNEAYSYMKLFGWEKERETDMSILMGAGSIISTPSDLNTFFSYLFSKKIVNGESLQQMKTLKDNFGLGLYGVPFYDIKGYGHKGIIDGFLSATYYFPEEDVAIALLENGVVYPLNDIVVGALSIYFDETYQLPEFFMPIVLKSEDLDKYLGVYSTSSLPLKITITKSKDILIAQGTGQPAFSLECFDENKFQFEQANAVIEFIPDENKMILRQNGQVFEMKKE